MFGYMSIRPEHEIYIERARQARSETWTRFFASIGRGVRAIAQRIRTEAEYVFRAPPSARYR